MVKKSKVRYPHRFIFAVTQAMRDDIFQIAALANEDASEVVRRMVRRETPFFVDYASRTASLPNGETTA